jgi:hypothetical protein
MGRFEKHFEMLPITLAMHCLYASDYNYKHLIEFSLAVCTTGPYSESCHPTKIAHAKAPSRTMDGSLPETF